MRVYDVYQYGRVIDTVHARSNKDACLKVSNKTGIPVDLLASALVH